MKHDRRVTHERLEAVVHGIVQGVFFRYSTRLMAKELRLTGTVANRPDGTVHVVAEGPREPLEDLGRWLHVGSDAAVVERVDVSWGRATGAFRDFEVRR